MTGAARSFGCRAFLTGLAMCIAGPACQSQKPGDALGVYRVEGRLLKNGCGQTGDRFRRSFSFDVELRHRDGVGYWVVGSKRPVPGDLQLPEGRFTFQLEQRLTWQHAEAQPSCTLLQREVIEGVLQVSEHAMDAGSSSADAGMPDAPQRLNAESSIQVAPLPGSDCGRAVAPAGPFPTLPCTASYELEGSRLEGSRLER